MTICTITRERAYVIAEIGQNHNGSVDTAKRLIDAAHYAGADAVKSQKRDVHCPPPEWDRPYNGPHSYGATYTEHRRALELSTDAHRALRDYAHARGLDYSCSAWDVGSLADVETLDPPWHKIASAHAADTSWVGVVCALDRPVILSTGGLDDVGVDLAVKHTAQAGGWVAVMQCTMAYPVEAMDVHLDVLAAWTRRVDAAVPPWDGVDCVGLSGHHRGIALDGAAVAVGARVIERHLTLDRTSKGTDHAASLEPDGFRKLVRDMRAVEAAMAGDGCKRVLDVERASIAKLRGKP